MRFRSAVVMAIATVLSACGWVGPPFYKGDPADAGPIKPGVYKVDVLDDGKPAHTYRAIWLPDGSVSWTPLDPKKDEEPARQISVRFAVLGRQLWILQDVPDKDQTDVSYGLAELHDDVLWLVPFIDCDSTVEIVRVAGGEVETRETSATNLMDAESVSNPVTSAASDPPMSDSTAGHICRFKDRASLERALRAYIATNPSWVRVRFKRIGD